jgi:outer membrane receptor protein involved in Fe transport
MRKLALVWLAAALLIATPALAQETRGSIEGVAKDASGGVLPGVTVLAKSAGASQTSVTDANGTYRFPALQPGTYTLTATLQGFTDAKVDNIDLGIGKLLRVELTLKIAGMAENVSVKAEPPIVDVKQDAVSTTITSDIIDLIPRGRDWLSAIQGIAGTGNESKGGGTMIDGAGASENRYILDGMDTTNLLLGTSGVSVLSDFIDQVQVKQSGYSPEFRASTGGVISAITKSGTNVYHGDVGTWVSGRPMRGMLGNPRASLGLDPNDNTKAIYTTSPRLNETVSTDGVYDLNGPIFKDKMWFFFGYNPQVSTTNRTITWATPAGFPPTQSFSARSTQSSARYNVTDQVTHNIRVRFNGSNERDTGGLSLPSITTTTGTSTSNAATFNPRPTTFTASPTYSYNGTMDWVLNNKTYVNVSSGYLFYGSHTEGGTFNPAIVRSFSTTNVNQAGVPAQFQHASGFSDGASSSFNLGDNYNRYNLSSDITRYSSWHGQHAFKLGAQYERLGNDVNTGSQYPTVAIRWASSYTTLTQQSVTGTYGYYEVRRIYTVGNIHSNNIGLFAQDQWTVSNKLTLNYGLRSDHTVIPSYRPENPGITFGWGDKLAPRVGFAYDIKGDGKWKGYGSWGQFYDIEKLEMPRGAWGADHWISYYWTLDNPDFTAINCDGTPTSGCPGTFIEQDDFRHVSNDPNDNLVDPNLKPYKTEELVFGLDHEVSRLISVGTRWSHKWLDQTFEDVGVQVPGVGEVFYIANPGYGLGAYPLGTDFPRTPFPVRRYDGLELNFRRRMANHWSLNGNLLFARTFGNYSGLTSSDENGRNAPDVNRYYDGLYISFDDKGQPLSGNLATDRPVEIKMLATYQMPWGTNVGVNFQGFSGLLQSTTVTYANLPIYVYGRGDLGRTPFETQTDLNFAHHLTIKKKYGVDAQFIITNLFDQGTVEGFSTAQFRDALTLPGGATQFFAGFDPVAIQAAANAVKSTTGRLDPRYGLASSFQSPRQARLLIKFVF